MRIKFDWFFNEISSYPLEYLEIHYLAKSALTSPHFKSTVDQQRSYSFSLNTYTMRDITRRAFIILIRKRRSWRGVDINVTYKNSYSTVRQGTKRKDWGIFRILQNHQNAKIPMYLKFWTFIWTKFTKN